MKQIKLSPTALNLFQNCPRCFWLEKVKYIRRPRGIFPSLPGGMDRVIKTYFDRYRLMKTLPPELDGEAFEGVQLYSDQSKIDRWRDWKTGLTYRDRDGASLFGALDDLLIKQDRTIPFDYKTKGSPSTTESAVKYYQSQLDGYALLLEENGMPTAGYGVLLYYSPKAASEKGTVLFECQTIRVETDTARARDLFRRACALLKGVGPEMNPACEYCMWFEKMRENETSSLFP
jgi:CRISPR/Cas system-associated exonuclease Cas4 (RecB family)